VIFDTRWPRLFAIPDNHRLDQDSERQVERHGTQRCTRWFVERDERSRVVARYRCWTSRGTVAPFHQQLGWERYSPDGTLLVREVRYDHGERASGEHGPWLN